MTTPSHAAPLTPEPGPAAAAPGRKGGLLVLGLASLIVGLATGLVGALFLLALKRADDGRNLLIAWAHGKHWLGLFIVTAVVAGAAALAAWLVRRFSPAASGSGIPQVEAVLKGDLPVPIRLIPIKFVGGLLAIGAGLALGREGPSVQMGANIGNLVGKAFRSDWPDRRVLLAAGAGAGLATAFNAPIAGAVFVLEELVQRFEPRIAIAALGASATAIAIARIFLHETPDFHVDVLPYASFTTRWLYFVLGAAAGLVAILYNRSLLATIAAAERLDRWPAELRAAVVGAVVGILGWIAPELIGGGDPITQRTLAGLYPLSLVPLIFVIRFGLGAISYAARTPGGLFAPLLVLGAQFGLLFGALCRFAFPSLDIHPEGFAIVGMAALLTGVVRAPLTGIVLVVEMTASVEMLLPMLGACFAAMLVPSILRDPPLYESLRANVLRQARAKQAASPAETLPG